MKHLLLWAGLGASLCTIACNGPVEPDNATERADTLATTAPASARQCYQFAALGDTARLAIEEQDGNITGTLRYGYSEKDRNDGTIRGTMRGDTLYADYEFQSEGVTSVREVVFLRRGSAWVEGYGPGRDENGKFSLYRDSLDFSNDLLLQPVDCATFN